MYITGGVFVRLWISICVFFASCSAACAEADQPTDDLVDIYTVNRVSVVIERSADAVWQNIKNGYLTGSDFTEIGYSVQPLDPGNLSAQRGGYRMTLKDAEGKPVDDRTVIVAALNDEHRWLALIAWYHVDLSPEARNLEVTARYSVDELPGGASEYTLFAQSKFQTAIPTGEAPSQYIANLRTEAEKSSEAFLLEHFAALKAQLEAKQ